MLLDTYAWIEFFIQSGIGEKIKEILKKNQCYTSIVSLAEISQWCLKNEKDYITALTLVKSFSQIIDVGDDIAALAGKINFERKKTIKNWGIIDSFILATANMYHLRVVTGDHHFKNIKDVIFLE